MLLLAKMDDHFLKWRTGTFGMTQLASGQFNVNNHAHLVQGSRNLHPSGSTITFLIVTSRLTWLKLDRVPGDTNSLNQCPTQDLLRAPFAAH